MIQPWKRKKHEVVFENTYAKLDKIIFELPDGKDHDYYIHGKPMQLASVFAVMEDGRIVLAREYRPGPDKVLDEIPGGGVDEGEDPLAAAERELFEEVGCKGDIQYLGKSFVSAYSPIVKNCFLAINCQKVAEPSGDEQEFIEVVFKTKEEFQDQMNAGLLTDMETALLAFRALGY